MLKRFRFIVSANLVVVLFISTLILSNPVRVSACEDSPPATLLSLYFGSGLIVLADIKSVRDGKVISDESDYVYIEIERNLRVFSVLKGKTKSNLVFTQSEYRSKAPQTEESAEDPEVEIYYPYGYKNLSNLTVGERYLFFLRKNAETGQYELTDETSGAKKLSDYDLDIHKKRIKELKSIADKKENQLTELTEWIMRCIDDPATRWDGVISLNNSFESLEYSEENGETEEQDEEAFVIGKDFNDYTPKIAQSLTDQQKDHISGILFGSLQQNLFEKDTESFNYIFAHLVKRWDKMRLAIYAFSLLQTMDKSEADKTETLMNYISGILGDGKLYEITERYSTVDSEEETEENAERKTNVESSETTENEIVKTVVEENKQTSENIGENQVKVAENQENPTLAEQPKEEPSPEKLTPAQKREKSLRDFISRYEYLLVRGFPVESETEIAEGN